MKTRLEFVSGSSNKFWEIDESSGEATWGKIGTDGQGTKVYESYEIDKKIAEKIAKGYRRVSEHPALEMARQDLKNARASVKPAVNFLEELKKVK